MKKELKEKNLKLKLEKRTITTLSNNQMSYIKGAVNCIPETADIAGCTGRPTKTKIVQD